MSLTSNLPPVNKSDSAAGTKLFFDTYGNEPLEFLAAEVSAAISFFSSKGFDNIAATQTAAILLKQAKLDGISIFNILDKLSGFDTVKLNSLVAEILNNNRFPTSTLGFVTMSVEKQNQTRNIFA
jgi:hypothetical protein